MNLLKQRPNWVKQKEELKISLQTINKTNFFCASDVGDHFSLVVLHASFFPSFCNIYCGKGFSSFTLKHPFTIGECWFTVSLFYYSKWNQA